HTSFPTRRSSDLCLENKWRTTDLNIYICLLDFRITHLRCNSTFVDQVVQTLLSCCTTNRRFIEICGTDCLVSLLGTFGSSLVFTGLYILLSHFLPDLISSQPDCKIGKIDRVGTHVGNLSLFIQTLGNRHGLPY